MTIIGPDFAGLYKNNSGHRGFHILNIFERCIEMKERCISNYVSKWCCYWYIRSEGWTVEHSKIKL